ncbi:hypothetical protein D3C84_971220 [compost metagenome]
MLAPVNTSKCTTAINRTASSARQENPGKIRPRQIPSLSSGWRRAKAHTAADVSAISKITQSVARLDSQANSCRIGSASMAANTSTTMAEIKLCNADPIWGL